jgi:hypothetical protein
MRALLYVLFLVCLSPILIGIDLVRWPVSKFQPAKFCVRRGFPFPVEHWGSDPIKQTFAS